MSVSGPSSASFQPVTPAEATRIGGEAQTLLANLKAIAEDPSRLAGDVEATFGGYGSWATKWIKSYLESNPGTLTRVDEWSDNVSGVVANVLSDGKVTTDEVETLVREASDFGAVQDSEKQVLTSLLNENAAKFDPVARQALADFLGVANPFPVQATGTTTPVDPITPAEPWQPPTSVLAKHGLNTTGPKTDSVYEGDEWGSVGYYSYTGSSGQYASFAKFQDVYGKGAEDGHSWFESYSNPPGGLESGSFILSGSISESNFEATAGVDVSGSRKINNDLYEAIREAGSKRADFQILNDAGDPVSFGAGDKLVAMKQEGGDWVKADRSDWNVTFRIQRADGSFDASATKTADYSEAIGVDRNVKFDFLDERGRRVSFNPSWGDKMAESFQDGDQWHALAKNDDGTYDHRVFDKDGNQVSQDVLDETQKTALTQGKDTMLRVLGYDNKLRGDGKVGGDFNMGWWGKCHNVAALSTSAMARPTKPFSVVTNVDAGETLALQLADKTLVRKADGGYTEQTRDAQGGVSSSRDLTKEEAEALPGFKDASAVVIKTDGSLKPAEFQTFNPGDVDALTSHIGNGATTSEGFEGQRYYATQDVITLKDGTKVKAHIKSVGTEGGKTIGIGERDGFDYDESDRSALRAPGMRSYNETDTRYNRTYARNGISMADLNAYRGDDIKTLTIIEPNGKERTIDASDVKDLVWENKMDFRPDQLWKLHETVNDKGSTVTETYSGTQVWNYATRSANTESIDPATLTAAEKELAKEPGMMAGTTDDTGKFYFKTQISTEGGDKDLTYWVKFDDDGNVSDYAYLGDASEVADNLPDFTWTSHVKDPYASTWPGAAQAPGISNEEVRRVYLASQGAFQKQMVGGFITTSDLQSAQAVKPE